MQRPVALVVAAVAAEDARNAVLEYVAVVRPWPEQGASPVKRAQRIDHVVVVHGRRVRWPQQRGRHLGCASAPRPAGEDRPLLAQRQIGIVDDVARMGKGACRIQQRVEIEWTVVAPVARRGSPLAFLVRGVRVRGVRVGGRLDFFSNAWSGGDDLVGVAETFKCLRKELLRRA